MEPEVKLNSKSESEFLAKFAKVKMKVPIAEFHDDDLWTCRKSLYKILPIISKSLQNKEKAAKKWAADPKRAKIKLLCTSPIVMQKAKTIEIVMNSDCRKIDKTIAAMNTHPDLTKKLREIFEVECLEDLDPKRKKKK